MIRVRALALAAVGAVSLTACGAVADGPVRDVAQRFGTALARHDGAQACAFLTDTARHATETFGRDCAAQLATLPDPGAEGAVEVWGDAAQVRFARDTVFLVRFPDGWRVLAAGCTPRGEQPYRCEVRG